MVEGSIEQGKGLNPSEQKRLAEKLDAAGWGLFFVWLGIVLLMNISFGVGLIGVAIIVLGEQAIRRYFGLKLEGFWLIVGLILGVGGSWELLGVELALVPVLLIVAGLLILFKKVLPRR